MFEEVFSHTFFYDIRKFLLFGPAFEGGEVFGEVVEEETGDVHVF